MVFRSIPVTRSIWRWLVPASSKVNIVVCRCGFKTFNPVSLKSEGVKVTSCLVLTEVVKQPGLTRRHAALRVGEFEVAKSGGIWVAIRAKMFGHRLFPFVKAGFGPVMNAFAKVFYCNVKHILAGIAVASQSRFRADGMNQVYWFG